MNPEVAKIRVSQNRLLMFSPWLLWLLVVVLPLIFGKLLLEKAIEIDKDLWRVSARQLLMNEAQKYKASLDPNFFLAKALDIGHLGDLYSLDHRLTIGELKQDEIIRGIESRKALREHVVSRHLPWESENVKRDITAFLDALKKRVGSNPEITLCLGPDEHSRFYIAPSYLTLPVTEAEFAVCLERAYRQWLNRFTADSTSGRFFKFYKKLPELEDWLGFFYPPNCEIAGKFERFSGKLSASFHHFILNFKDASGQPVSLNLFYQHSKLKWQEVLKRVFAQENRGKLRHRFGYSSLANLPIIVETEKSIDFVFELPEKFKKIYLAQAEYDGKKLPVLCLSLETRQSYSALLNKANLGFFMRMLLLLTLPIPIGISLQRLKGQKSLKWLLGVSFAVGAIVPLMGLMWLTVSFVNSQKYFEAEKVMAEMGRMLEQKEKKMLLQQARNEVYYHLLAYQAGKLDLNTRKKLSDILKNTGTSMVIGNENFSRPVNGYFMLNCDGFEQLEVKQSLLVNMLQLKPFFSGYYNELLLELGSFADLSISRRREIQQKAQLAQGITEQLSDKGMFRQIAEFSGAKVSSTMTPRQEFFSGYFLDRSEDRPGSFFIVYSENSEWLRQIHMLMRDGQIPISKSFAGFDISMAFYRLDTNNMNYIHPLAMPDQVLKINEQEYLNELGRALFTNSGYHAINNLAESPPNLILAKTLADRNFFALAYAVKKKGYANQNVAFLAILVIIVALGSVLILTLGTTKELLKFLPAFLEAIGKVQKQDYNWQIEIKSGDEFEGLGQSFNLMGRKLLEREKMSQLVSQDALEAISTSGSDSLRPGGERRHAAILFSDIRGFTSLSEKYKAEEVVEMLNSYFSAMASIISENGGIIDKLIGDAIQAVFYQREGMEAAELRASRAAIAMKKSLTEYNQERRRAGRFEINNGIGIASGEVISGRVGSETGKLDATVLGPKLRLAETLEAKSKYALRQSILIDEQTALVLKEHKQKAELLPFQPETSDERVFELANLSWN